MNKEEKQATREEEANQKMRVNIVGRYIVQQMKTSSFNSVLYDLNLAEEVHRDFFNRKMGEFSGLENDSTNERSLPKLSKINKLKLSITDEVGKYMLDKVKEKGSYDQLLFKLDTSLVDVRERRLFRFIDKHTETAPPPAVVALPIKIDDTKTLYFIKTKETTTGGQTSGDSATVFQETTDNAPWLHKISRSIFNEYLGYTAYRALGIVTPNFEIGIRKEDNSIVFLQRYLNNYDNIRRINGKTLKEDELKNEFIKNILQVTPIFVAAAILGDDDVFGMSGDNIFLELEDNNFNQLINIDCGRVNLSSDPVTAVEWLSPKPHHLNSLFNNFMEAIYADKDCKDIFFNEVRAYLKNLNIEKFKDSLQEAYNKFVHVCHEVKDKNNLIGKDILPNLQPFDECFSALNAKITAIKKAYPLESPQLNDNFIFKS